MRLLRCQFAMTSGTDWWALVSVALVIVAVLVFSVDIDRFHVVGEASIWFMDSVYQSHDYGIGTAGHFPFISQHYDESALLYPVIYGLMHRGADADGTFTAIYWIMLSVGRASVGVLIYLAARALGANRLSALLALAFVCGASLSLNFISTHLLFDLVRWHIRFTSLNS